MLWIKEEEVFTRLDYGSAENSAECSISLAFVVMMWAEKIRRLLRHFLSLILPGYAPGNDQLVSAGGRNGQLSAFPKKITRSY